MIASIRFAVSVRYSAPTQRRNKFAFSLLAKATAAIDTPGLRQADTTFALNSALCLRLAYATAVCRRAFGSSRRMMDTCCDGRPTSIADEIFDAHNEVIA